MERQPSVDPPHTSTHEITDVLASHDRQAPSNDADVDRPVQDVEIAGEQRPYPILRPSYKKRVVWANGEVEEITYYVL